VALTNKGLVTYEAYGNQIMDVISLGKLETFYKKYGDSKSPLLAWYHLIASQRLETPEQLRASFPQVDYVRPFHVFNIGRGYRLIVMIQFDGQRAIVRHVMTHREYDRGKWKIK